MKRPLTRRLAAALYMAGVLVMCLRAGEPEKLWWWLLMVPFAIWIASPVLGGLYLWRHFSGVGIRAVYAALLAVVAIAGFGLQWHTMFVGPPDAQNALILLFIPLYQWMAIGASYVACKLIDRYGAPS